MAENLKQIVADLKSEVEKLKKEVDDLSKACLVIIKQNNSLIDERFELKKRLEGEKAFKPKGKRNTAADNRR